MLLPPRHVSSGCFQASPLYSPNPVLCLCVCSMVVTSLAVSRLRVAFWDNPSHKAGARGAVLVSVHGKLEGWPAGQVSFLRHRLTPGLCSGTDRVPIRACGSHNFPIKPCQGREQGPCPFRTPVSLPWRGVHPRTSTALPQGLLMLAAPCGRACRGTSIPTAATRTGKFLFPGTGQMAAHGPASVPGPARLPKASALCGSWTVTQPGNQHRGMGGGEKPSWPSLTEAEVLHLLFLTKQLLLG